jgi:hypothetical protein
LALGALRRLAGEWQGAFRQSRMYRLDYNHVCTLEELLFKWRNNPVLFNVAPPRQERNRLKCLHEEALNEKNKMKEENN